MAILIDGYNLLYGSGILARGIGPRTLERARTALLNFLAESLEPDEIAHTIVVFDAESAPPGLPRHAVHRGVAVRFAEVGHIADDLIEELILADSTPRRLTVVSSDHRLQKAARRRKARAVDSDVWHREIVRRRNEGSGRPESESIKPGGTVSEDEIAYWLATFGLDDRAGAPEAAGAHETPDAHDAPLDDDVDFDDADLGNLDLDNPFPPGYGEDITDDDL